MAATDTLLSVTTQIAAIAFLGGTAWFVARSLERPSARPFGALVGVVTVWAVCWALGTYVKTPFDTVLGTLTAAAALAAPGVWWVYVRRYTGRGPGFDRRSVAIVGTLALSAGLASLLESTAPLSPLSALAEAAANASALASIVLGLYATSRLVSLTRRQGRVSRRQTAVLTAALLTPYAAYTGIGASGTAFLCSGVLFGVSTWQYPVLTGFPKADHVARSRMIENLQEPVIVLDWDGVVLDANASADSSFAPDSESLVDEPITDTIGRIAGVDLSPGATGTVSLQTTIARREFEYSVSAVGPTGDDTNPVARTVLLRDVTDRLTREQRLSVLNRILRHNVRNDLDIVLAHANRIEDERTRSAIESATTTLLDLGRKAREAETVMSAATTDPSPVDLAGVARTVAEESRSEAPDARIVVDAPDTLLRTTHRNLVKRALAELVENAVEYSGEGPADVQIRVQSTDDGTISLSVTDHGPTIPRRERTVVQSGTETQLEHGQGIGLWLVSWAVSRLGGDLTFSENDPSGNVVTIRLYDW